MLMLPFIFPGYLFGSVPFGLLLTRLAGLGDIRAIGSGNIGATNVLRTGNKGSRGDIVARCREGRARGRSVCYLGPPDAALWSGLGAVVGHLFPVWLGFKGGKGTRHRSGCVADGGLASRSRRLRRMAARRWIRAALLVGGVGGDGRGADRRGAARRSRIVWLALAIAALVIARTTKISAGCSPAPNPGLVNAGADRRNNHRSERHPVRTSCANRRTQIWRAFHGRDQNRRAHGKRACPGCETLKRLLSGGHRSIVTARD